MLCLKGSHGTTKHCYNSITKNGFQLGSGRRGTGVYFWAEQYNYEKLARNWYSFCKKKGEYEHHEPNSHGIIIFVNILTEEDFFLDLEDIEIKHQIALLAEKQNAITNNNDSMINSIYDLYIERLELKLGKNFKFKIFKSTTIPPRECKFPLVWLSAPYIYVVRDTNIIQIDRYEDIEQ